MVLSLFVFLRGKLLASLRIMRTLGVILVLSFFIMVLVSSGGCAGYLDYRGRAEYIDEYNDIAMTYPGNSQMMSGS